MKKLALIVLALALTTCSTATANSGRYKVIDSFDSDYAHVAVICDQHNGDIIYIATESNNIAVAVVSHGLNRCSQ